MVLPPAMDALLNLASACVAIWLETPSRKRKAAETGGSSASLPAEHEGGSPATSGRPQGARALLPACSLLWGDR